MTYLTHQRHKRVAGGHGALVVNLQRAAEPRPELSPGRGFASLGSTQLKADRAPERRHKLPVINASLFTDSLSPLRGSANLIKQPRARRASPLGLILTAAPQLVEGSRLNRVVAIGSIRRGSRRYTLLTPAPLTTRHSIHFANILASHFGQGLTKVY